MRTRGPDSRCSCSVPADDPSALAEGTDGCGAGWSSPPKGRPLKTTNATKRRTAANATAVRLTRSPQRSASLTATASCSAPAFCCLGRRGGPEGATALLRSRAVLSTGRARRTTSPLRLRARTASCNEAAFCCLGRRGATEGLTGSRSGRSRAVASRSSLLAQWRQHRALLAQWCQHRDLVAQCCQPVVRGERPHASAPAQLRAVKHRSAVCAAAPEPKAQRPPYPDPVAQCCQDDHCAVCQPILCGEPPHASAPAQLRAVKRPSAVSAAEAEPKA